MLLVLLLAACGRGGPAPAAAPPPVAEAPEPDYRAPPEPVALVRDAEGAISLQGRAAPSSQVRLASPAGARIETTADGSGVWSAALGPVSEPTLYGLSSETDGRRVQAEGYVAVMPGGPTAALLRAGSGAEVLPGVLGAPPAGLRLQALDFDASGAAVASGRAPPRSPLRVVVDGGLMAEGEAGPDGRFSLALPKPLPFGPHRIQLLTPRATTLADVGTAPPVPPREGPYQASPDRLGWRIDWITPGGGLQTTLLLTQASPAGGAAAGKAAP